jgi:hypothetical protein
LELKRLEELIAFINQKISQEAGTRFTGKLEKEIRAILIAYAVQKNN